MCGGSVINPPSLAPVIAAVLDRDVSLEGKDNLNCVVRVGRYDAFGFAQGQKPAIPKVPSRGGGPSRGHGRTSHH